MFVLFALLSLPLGAAGPGRPLDEATIQRLVDAGRRGDREALRSLYAQHVVRMMRAVRPLCPSDADAEDVVQETFAKAFGALDRYEPKAGARFVSWLLVIARNTAQKNAKKRARTVPVAPEEMWSIAGGTEPVPGELGGLRRALLGALAEIDPRDRWILCLRYGGELEASEVAAIVGLNTSNVRKICERQSKHLRQKLGEWS